MFEVGKRYRSNQSYEELLKGEIYTLITLRQKDIAEWKNENDEYIGTFCLFRFDPTPIDDAPAPRMVATCDIGARVVRVKIDERDSKDLGCPIGEKLTIKKINKEAGGFLGSETGNWYYLSDFALADEQPKKEKIETCPACAKVDEGIDYPDCTSCLQDEQPKKEACLDIQKEEQAKVDKDTDKTPPDPAPVITQKNKSDPTPQAMIMIGSKPRLMYGSLLQIQGPTKDEEARNARTEEERKRYER